MSRAATLVLTGSAVSVLALAWLSFQEELEGTGFALRDYGLEPPELPEPPDFAGFEGAIAPAAAFIEDLVGLGPDANEVYAMSAESNVAAFLAAVRAGEGTAGANGYRTLFGRRLFDNFADHPRIKVTANLGGTPITSTAAGAYQFLERTWDDVQRALKLPDFSPASQDAAAVWLIRRRGALADVRAGRFDRAVAKCAREWASLPGSPYGQPTRSIEQARAVYESSGGTYA